MSARNYIDNSPQVTLTAALNATSTSASVSGTAGLPATPFAATVDYGTSSAEVVLVTNISGSTLTITRHWNGASAFSHSVGATLVHTAVAQDYADANNHVNASSGVHGVTGSMVGTSDTQTLTNKTVSGPAATFTDLTATNFHGLPSVSQVATGTILPFGGMVPPAGYLPCDGSAVSRTTYAALFAATNFTVTPTAVSTSGTTPNVHTYVTVASTTGLGLRARLQVGTDGFGQPLYSYVESLTSTVIQMHGDCHTAFTVGTPVTFSPWGVGDGSTTFNVPDLRGLFLQGASATGGPGDSGGSAAHNHTLSAGYAQITASGGAVYENQVSGEPSWPVNARVTGAAATASGTATTGAQLGGSTDSTSNLPPYLAVTYIIKT